MKIVTMKDFTKYGNKQKHIDQAINELFEKPKDNPLKEPIRLHFELNKTDFRRCADFNNLSYSDIKYSNSMVFASSKVTFGDLVLKDVTK